MIIVFYGLLGLIVGSFLNVLILRRGAQPVTGRSACMNCGTKLAWFDLVPVFSWVALRGRCRSCSSPISIQYPLVEISTAILFAFVGSMLHSPVHVLDFIIAALFVAIAVYDLRHTIIPDEWVYPCAALALVVSFVDAFQMGGWSAAGFILIAGPLTALPLFALWLVSKGEWMGLGDSKLALALGWLLGPILGMTALFFAFILGAIVGLALIFFSSPAWKKIKQFTPILSSQKAPERFTMKSEIPFGPFLILSCITLWILNFYTLVPLQFLGIVLP